jgi:redox-sensing transcriptional repressor
LTVSAEKPIIILARGGIFVEKDISQAVIRRLPRYYRYLGELLDEGVERISSGDLSSRMNVTASQIRQDLNNFGVFGQQGYGYNVKYLYDEIGRILGLDQKHNIIVIGAGNLGQALTNYSKFEKFGFQITALFDINPDLKGKKFRDIPVYMLEELDNYCNTHKVDIATLTMPKDQAREMAERLAGLGIHAIWNFAHVDLYMEDESVIVENVHLSDSLMHLSYNIVKNRRLLQ